MLSAFDLIREMEAVRRDFDRFFRSAGLDRGLLPTRRFAFLPAQGARTYPLLNVTEDDSTVYVDALAPGMDPGSLELNVVGNQLNVSGEKPGIDAAIEPSAYHRSERGAARFVRTITLPAEVDSAKARARYRNGIMRISMPKSETAKPRQIPVSMG